ncbi:MAG TPA: RNA polymerase sigma factor [Trueperaceae bacterium]|nr:RNA polymerase sigma factor [Trueperaceae bacterium]
MLTGRLSRAERAAVAVPSPEAELVARAAAGEEAAFETIMRSHNQLLFRTARSILKSDAEAEDAVQDAFLRAWLALDTFRAESKLSTWLVRIVTNEALGRLRRAKVRTIPLEEAMTSPDPKLQLALADAPGRGPEQTASRAQLRELIERQIDLLPADYRTVFMLSAVEGLSAVDIAVALDIPAATVRTRAFRARNLLREGLAGTVEADLGAVFAFDGERCDRIVARVIEMHRRVSPDV